MEELIRVSRAAPKRPLSPDHSHKTTKQPPAKKRKQRKRTDYIIESLFKEVKTLSDTVKALKKQGAISPSSTSSSQQQQQKGEGAIIPEDPAPKNFQPLTSNAASHLRITAQYPTVLKHTFAMLVCGASRAGKTTFIVKLLQYRNLMINPQVENVLWYSGNLQAAEHVKSQLSSKDPRSLDMVQFMEGEPNLEELTAQSTDVRRLLVLDDLYSSDNSSTKQMNIKVQELFTKLSHHNNISVIYVTQNPFIGNVNITRNATHLLLMRSVLDQAPYVQILSRHQYARKKRGFPTAVLEDVNTSPFGYLLIDGGPTTAPCMSFRTQIFPDEENVFYVAKGTPIDSELQQATINRTPLRSTAV